MKRAALVVLFAAAALAASAQQVTKVGICDFTRVMNTSYREAKTVREFLDAQAAVRKEQAAIEKEIAELENQRLEADKAKNAELALALDKKLADKRRYLDDYKRIKTEWARNQQQTILGSSTFLKEILEVVKVVAEGQGMALVLRSDGTAGAELMLYNIAEIDITDLVIREIFRRAGKTWTGPTD